MKNARYFPYSIGLYIQEKNTHALQILWTKNSYYFCADSRTTITTQ